MSELLDELRKVQRLGGDTYSSAEVIGLVGRSADEIERLYEARIEDALAQLEHANACTDEIERLQATNTRLRSYLKELSLMVECFDGRRNKGKIGRAAALAKKALDENAASALRR